MTSIEFGKKCRPYNIKYREIFGYVPCKDDYICNQDEFFEALIKSIETEKELSNFIPKRTMRYLDPEKKY